MAGAGACKVRDGQNIGGADALFTPFRLGRLSLANRIVMSPMTRSFSPGGVPGANVAEYYRRRAAGGTGLIITEGTWVPHVSASNNPSAPDFYGQTALAGWRGVVQGGACRRRQDYAAALACGAVSPGIRGRDRRRRSRIILGLPG